MKGRKEGRREGAPPAAQIVMDRREKHNAIWGRRQKGQNTTERDTGGNKCGGREVDSGLGI